ncbi:uncharacterized protein LOC143433500 [Xylocopa sonorina]|uniref:uncharacterized protein LOC143433500 n=1 Tax=Xylocopa sonorina TaxID=1818115 RepID=UPI00403AC7F2
MLNRFTNAWHSILSSVLFATLLRKKITVIKFSLDGYEHYGQQKIELFPILLFDGEEEYCSNVVIRRGRLGRWFTATHAKGSFSQSQLKWPSRCLYLDIPVCVYVDLRYPSKQTNVCFILFFSPVPYMSSIRVPALTYTCAKMHRHV